MTDTRSARRPDPTTPSLWNGRLSRRRPQRIGRDRRNRPGPRDARGRLPDVLYVPLDDVDQRHLRRKRAPHLVPVQGRGFLLRHRRWRRDGADLTAAVWYYDDPFPAVADIKGHVAFYADRVAITATPSESAVR